MTPTFLYFLKRLHLDHLSSNFVKLEFDLGQCEFVKISDNDLTELEYLSMVQKLYWWIILHGILLSRILDYNLVEPVYFKTSICDSWIIR